MSAPADEFIFDPSAHFTLATNTFVRVPTIIQYEDTPLIEVVTLEKLMTTSKIQVYHSDGTHLATVKGAQAWTTAAGEKAGVCLSHPDKMTVCELDGRTVFTDRTSKRPCGSRQQAW